MSNRIKNIVCCLVSLMVGLMMYILFRPTSIIAKPFAQCDWIAQLCTYLHPYSGELMRFHIPDFLWAFSLSCGLQVVFVISKTVEILSCALTAFACGVIWEILQYAGVVSGTADWLDILMYFLAVFASILINLKERMK